MRNKYTALIMVMALCLLTFLPCYDANAIPTLNTYTYDIAQGNITISAGANSGTLDIQYFSQFGTQLVDNITTGQAITIKDSNPNTPTTNYVTVEPNLGTLNITLENVNIITNSVCPFSIGSGLTVNLTLSGNNYLNAGASNYAGLGVPSGTALDITAASTGSLRSTGGSGTGGSGIGGGGGGNGGIVTVNGGTVMAYGGQGGSGIGGGGSGNGGIVTVNGGMVTAKGGPGGSGIGGGWNGNGGTMTVNGGTVTATGGNGGSGIGGGDSMAGGTATVNGGMVVATGGYCGSGIGGGWSGNGGTVTVNGGTVTATGSNGSSGIGGGYNGSGGYTGSGGSLTIDGGSVWAISQPNVYNSIPIQEYLVTISGLPSSEDVTYKVNGGNSVSCSTNVSGNLYLWLPQTTGSPTDNIQITITNSGADYLAAGQVSSSNVNNFTAYPIPRITGISPTSGPDAGGTSVTISGSGFTGATAVKFSSTTGSGMTVSSDTLLTVTSPAGNGTVDLTVTTPNGTSAVVPSDQFTYVAPNQDQPAPTGLTGIAPTTAADNDGKITGVNDSMEYRLQGAANYTSVAPSAIVVTGLAAGTYQVRYAAGPGLNAGADAYVVVQAYTGHEGGGGSSAGGGRTTVTGSVLNGTTGANVANLTATVMTDIHGNYTVSMKAAQTVTCQQPDGTMSTLSDLSKVSYVSAGGSSLGVSADGTIKLLNLAKGTDNHYTITYDLGNGQTMTLGTLEVTVSSGGTVSVTCTLIDPYGIITDAATGKPIAGAKVSLYYANTERNKTNGKTPDTVVALPGIDGFKPNNNQNPQTSDGNGAYGFMVFPDTDYYIAASKDGYAPYTSPTISVGQDIVHWDFKMSTPITGVKRLAGQSQVDTALAIAKANYTGTLSNVVLATADNYPDALAGSVLAYQLNAPILLVGSSEADQAKVLDYMKANLASSGNVYILGGTVVVSADMEAKVKADGFSQITRLGGTDRYETSVKIAEQLKVKSETPIVLAYGENYPDALSISSIAAEMQYPILLVQKDGISDVVKNEIAAIKPSKVYLIGGEGVISSAVESQVEQITSLDKTNIIRIAGQDRYDTSLAVAQYFNLAGQSFCVATGSNFPDALAGSVYAANHNTSIIMAGGSLSDQVVNYLKDKKLIGVTLFGGEAVVSKDIEQRLSQLMVK